MCPEPEEILERAEGHEQTVGEAVEEEEDEVLVVVEGDAVVDPGAVVIHLQHAAPANGAVVRTVRLHTGALLTITHSALKETNIHHCIVRLKGTSLVTMPVHLDRA